MFTRENFLCGIKKLFPDCVISKDLNTVSYYDSIEYWDENDNEIEKQVGFSFSINEFDEIVSKIKTNSSIDNYILFLPNHIEVAITEQGHSNQISFRTMVRRYKKDLKIEQHDMCMEIESASNLYVIAIICSYALTDKIDKRLKYRLQDLSDIYNLESFCNHSGIPTVKLHSSTNIAPQKANLMIQAYLFNIAYKYDIAITLIGEFDNEALLRRKINREGQLFPYKTYVPALIKYYNQGLSSNISFAQYLAFYHVVEFFFQLVSEEELFQDIQNYITRPNFSPYSRSEIKSFYKMIKRKYLNQKDNDVLDERTSLLLCLKKYIVDLNSLKTTILSIDPKALDYYTSYEVPFADDGVKINFDSLPNDIYCAIQKRVYSVRNAIVHSKEGDKRRYEPFKHDIELAREIPLIRAVAEEIIINSGAQLKID